MNRTSRIIRIASALGLLLALVLLAACATDTGSSGDSSAAPSSGATVEPPTMTLVTPAAGAVVPAGTVTVAVETTGLEFVMPSNTNVAGQGHVHFTLDDGSEEMSVEKSFEFENVEPGQHTLEAQLVQNDTKPFDPPVKQTIEFTVE